MAADLDTRARLGSGIGALLNNFAASRLANRQQQQTDPNRPIGARDYLDILGKAYATQAAYPVFPGSTQSQIDPTDLIKMVQQLQEALRNPSAIGAPGQAQQAQQPQAAPAIQQAAVAPQPKQPTAQGPAPVSRTSNIKSIRQVGP